MVDNNNRKSSDKMFRIETTGIVRVNRGDTFQCPLFINKGTELYPIRFRLKD